MSTHLDIVGVAGGGRCVGGGRGVSRSVLDCSAVVAITRKILQTCPSFPITGVHIWMGTWRNGDMLSDPRRD